MNKPVKKFRGHLLFWPLSLSLALTATLVSPASGGGAEAATSKRVQAASGRIVWHDFDPALFERAKKEKKFVLLDLEAVWCHWCHVMDEETYADGAVVRMLNEHYICVRVDQDARPDLSSKYEDYGWPATIIFGPDGTEIVKRSGYINPQRMKRLLAAIVKDPSPEADDAGSVAHFASVQGAEAAADKGLSSAMLAELNKKHEEGYDSKYGGWGSFQKFLDWDSAEYALEQGLAGDEAALGRARGALDGQLNLIDPAFGGVYQYSTDGDWQHPHYEKIMQMQAENLRLFSLGYLVFGDKRYLSAAASIERYLNEFLSSPDGAFYTSQDADLVQGEHSEAYFKLSADERKKLGMPKIDKHIYARENGWAIAALTAYYVAAADGEALQRAKRAAQWIIANRSLTQSGMSGGFSHDQKDPSGPYLGDTLAMGRAFLALYEVTGERSWLERAAQAADFIGRHFTGSRGFLSADGQGRKIAAPEPLLDENVMMARFANRLFHYTGTKAYRQQAEHAMAYLAQPEVARKRRILVAGILLANRELSQAPLHITIVGAKSDPAAALLFNCALRLPQPYKRVEWFDSKEGALPNADVELPEMPRAAAFSCGNGICSTPAYSSDGLLKMYEKLTRREK